MHKTRGAGRMGAAGRLAVRKRLCLSQRTQAAAGHDLDAWDGKITCKLQHLRLREARAGGGHRWVSPAAAPPGEACSWLAGARGLAYLLRPLTLALFMTAEAKLEGRLGGWGGAQNRPHQAPRGLEQSAVMLPTARNRCRALPPALGAAAEPVAPALPAMAEMNAGSRGRPAACSSCF